MTLTKNKYGSPIDAKFITRITAKESPAHIRALKHSIDFIVDDGTPVKAAANGTVIEVKDDSTIGGKARRFEKYGNYIEIAHSHGEYSEYEHLKMGCAVVRVGDKVRRGQVIGYTGSTGWLAHLGPHLHFMVGTYGKTGKEYSTLEIRWTGKRIVNILKKEKYQ